MCFVPLSLQQRERMGIHQLHCWAFFSWISLQLPLLQILEWHSLKSRTFFSKDNDIPPSVSSFLVSKLFATRLFLSPSLTGCTCVFLCQYLEKRKVRVDERCQYLCWACKITLRGLEHFFRMPLVWYLHTGCEKNLLNIDVDVTLIKLR